MGNHWLMQLLFPKTCPICEDILPKKTEICESCRKKLQYIREPKCKKCGKPFETADEGQMIREYCADCVKRRHFYDRGMAVFCYNEEIKESIYRFKYHNQRTYADFYGQEICNRYGREIRRMGIEALIPVPISVEKQRKRGFNQAELIAKVVGEQLNIPVETQLIVRIKNTIPQKELNQEERRKNLNNAFQITENRVKYKKIMLVDDIYTTGSTIDACAIPLRKAGIEEVSFVSLSIGAGI